MRFRAPFRSRRVPGRPAWRGLAAALALLAAACTTAAPDEATTTSVSPAPPGTDLMEQVLGGTQTVQDFAIHIDMAKQTGDGLVSFYQEVLDRAATGAGEEVDLAGGFTFASTDSIEAQEVDGDGAVLPSLSVSFGLLTATAEVAANTTTELVSSLRAAGNTGAADILADSEPASAPLLVEIVTADLGERRTHVGPEDRSLVDITFTSVQPGDTLTSVYLFGQTLPGDPSEELGLSDDELFVSRWNRGLISFLAGDGGIATVVDEAVTAVPGSTIMSRETKNAILAAARYRAALNGVKIVDDILAEGDRGVAQLDEEDVVLSLDGPFVIMPKERFTMYVVTIAAVEACEAIAAGMNKRNGEESGAVGESSDPDQADDATTTTEKPGPGPVTCDPIRPRYRDTKLFLGSPAPAPAPAAVYGDVHVLTFDGTRYANQAAGEFALFDNGVASIQLRTEPFEGSDVVSVATAVAADVDGHSVSMHAGGDTYIDDEPADLTRGETTPVGDGALLWSPTGWVVAWPDGTAATIKNHDGYLTMLVVPSGAPSTGMLGDGDGDPGNDLVTRDGTALDPSATRFQTFYPEYVDTWRIDDDESLFRYGPGESTSTFTIAGFPAAETNVEGLRDAAREAALEVCREVGVTGDDLTADCILDVALTGDESFAYAAFLVETSTPAPEDAPLDSGPGPAATGPDTLTVGELTFGFGPDPIVVDSGGFQPQWRCSVDDGSFHATSRYVEAPEREVTITIEYLDAATSGTGEARFEVLVELNSQPYAWMLTFVQPAPGTLDTLSLDGATLVASGTAFLNDPLDPNLAPFMLLPDGSTFQPFRLTATCDQ